MSKRATIAKVTGEAVGGAVSDEELLRDQAVVELARHISNAISLDSGARRKPSRSACAQVALQVLLVTTGIRRAALVDALAFTAAQASRISRRLGALAKQQREPWWDILSKTRFLHHVPTSQTFIVSTQERLWYDAVRLKDRLTTKTAHQQEADSVLWCDARLTPEHNAPTLTSPDAHIASLIETVRAAVTRGDDRAQDALIVSGPELEHAEEQSDASMTATAQAQFVGITLAGFLLEYGAIYCLHDAKANHHNGDNFCYTVQSLEGNERLSESSFAASPANCLGSQPLVVFRVLWADHSASLELLSFSVPQTIFHDDRAEKLRLERTRIFQDRLQAITDLPSTFAARLRSGRITVQQSIVTLHQVAL